MMKYENIWISMTPDCGENKGGYYCQTYSDEEMDNQIDDFCIHTDDCNCNNQEDVENFIKRYAKCYSTNN